MNGNITQIEQAGKNGYGKKWREASACEPTCSPKPDQPKPDQPCPDPKCTEIIREKDSKETYFVWNTAQSEHKHTDSFSKLTWLLLGLSSLLFLGSILGNLFAVWALARSTETNNTSREVITTTNDTREVRVIEKVGYEGDEYYYYAPPARW
jgi:hypothetical protein